MQPTLCHSLIEETWSNYKFDQWIHCFKRFWCPMVWWSWLSGMSRCSTYDQLIDPKANLNLNHNPNPKQSNLRFTSHHVNKVRLSVTIPFTRSIHRITEQIFRNFNITIRFAFTKNTISKILTITIRACGWKIKWRHNYYTLTTLRNHAISSQCTE